MVVLSAQLATDGAFVLACLETDFKPRRLDNMHETVIKQERAECIYSVFEEE